MQTDFTNMSRYTFVTARTFMMRSRARAQLHPKNYAWASMTPFLPVLSATRLAITTNDKVVLGNALFVSVRLRGSLGADAMDWFWWAVKPVENGPTVVALSPSSMRQGQGALNEHQISVIG